MPNRRLRYLLTYLLLALMFGLSGSSIPAGCPVGESQVSSFGVRADNAVQVDGDRRSASPLTADNLETSNYDAFQRRILRDVLHPTHAWPKQFSPDEFLDLDKPYDLASVAVSKAAIPSDAEGKLTVEDFQLRFQFVDSMPGYANKLELDHVAQMVNHGSRDRRLEIHRKRWSEALDAEGPYRPVAYVSRIDELPFDPTDESRKQTVWQVSFLPSIEVALRDLSSSAYHTKPLGTEEWLITHKEPLEVAIKPSEALNALDPFDIVDLMWWKVGNYVGVSANIDPRSALLLLPGTAFTYRTTRFKVSGLDSVAGKLTITIQRISNPFYTNEDAH